MRAIQILIVCVYTYVHIHRYTSDPKLWSPLLYYFCLLLYGTKHIIYRPNDSFYLFSFVTTNEYHCGVIVVVIMFFTKFFFFFIITLICISLRLHNRIYWDFVCSVNMLVLLNTTYERARRSIMKFIFLRIDEQDWTANTLLIESSENKSFQYHPFVSYYFFYCFDKKCHVAAHSIDFNGTVLFFCMAQRRLFNQNSFPLKAWNIVFGTDS